MGIFKALFGAYDAPAFATDPNAVTAAGIDPAVFGLAAYDSPTSPAQRVSATAALQVGAVKRSRDLIAGTLATLPATRFNTDRARLSSPLLDQPETHRARSVTMSALFQDLLFESVAWWHVTERDWNRWPVHVRRVAPDRVTIDTARGMVYIDGVSVPDADLIRFDSPNSPLLVAGARAIRSALALDAAAYRYSDGAPPLDYFTPADGVDPADDNEVIDILDAWQIARQTRSTAYVPAALKYNIGGWSPEQLQLAAARQHAVLEIARVAGIDPEDLGVSTTSRTYQNDYDRRKAFVDLTLGGYRSAFEDRISMPDVTPRGHYVRLDLDAFLRSDPAARFAAYKAGLEVGALDAADIARLEDRPPVTNEGLATVTRLPVAAHTTPEATFSTGPADTFDAAVDTRFSVDPETRTIRGLVVPYGVTAVSRGARWQFGPGTIQTPADPSRVKLWINHDPNQAIGYATEFTDTPEGWFGAFKVAPGAEGDRALDLAANHVLDGLSLGVGIGGTHRVLDGVNHAVTAPAMEVSLTPAPAFADARVHAVAASAVNQERNTMPDETPASVAVIDPPTTATDPAASVWIQETISTAIAAGFANLAAPQSEGPAVVSATAEPVFVSEPSPYRFDGTRGAASFTEDLRDYNSNPEARHRLETLVDAAFAVTTDNTAALNPNRNRPDLYVPNLTYTYPLWDMISTGSIEDKTPFTVPKFSAATGLVAAHVEDTEPTPGSFSATSQTVSPSPVSGKIQIVREVWDAEGNPQADQIIWAEMLNAYFEAREARIATLLNGLDLTEINLASAVDAALVNALQNTIVDLQFVRGGNRYSRFAADGMLFKAMANAADSTGRKLLPVIGATNAQGSTSGGFDQIALGNLTAQAAWALGANNAANSYLFVPSSVWAWASAPKKFVFEYQVKSVDLAIWGYMGAACLRDSDVKRIDYTTADV